MSAIASRSRDERLGLHRVRLEVRPEALHDVGDEAQEDARVGHEELRLVVVADERQAALQDAPVLDVGDLGREVVALDAVRVVEEVQGVVDGQAEAGPPGDEPLVDLGRDADLGDLVEDLRRHGQQPDQRRPGARPEHHLEAALEGEHLGIEARAGDDVGQQVLDVVEDARLRDRVREVEDLLLEQELLFVVEHGRDGSTGPGGGGVARRRAPLARRRRTATWRPVAHVARMTMRGGARPFDDRCIGCSGRSSDMAPPVWPAGACGCTVRRAQRTDRVRHGHRACQSGSGRSLDAGALSDEASRRAGPTVTSDARPADLDMVTECVTLAFGDDPIWSSALAEQTATRRTWRRTGACFVERCDAMRTLSIADDGAAVFGLTPAARAPNSRRRQREALEALLERVRWTTRPSRRSHELYDRFAASRAA